MGKVKPSKPRHSILDNPIILDKNEVSGSSFALLFCEIVRYCESKSNTECELMCMLSDYGRVIAQKTVDILHVREKNYRRAINTTDILIFIKSKLLKHLFGKENTRLEKSTHDDCIYYIIEEDAIINKFVSAPKDRKYLNCSSITAGIIEEVLRMCGFRVEVSSYCHGRTTYVIKFNEENLKFY